MAIYCVTLRANRGGLLLIEECEMSVWFNVVCANLKSERGGILSAIQEAPFLFN